MDDKIIEDKLFNGVELNNINLIRNLNKNDVKRLFSKRRLFNSDWSSPEEEKQTAYQRACLLGHTEIVKYFISLGIDVDQNFSPGNSSSTIRGAFIFACQSRSISTITTLINSGASVDQFGSCSINYLNSFLPQIRLNKSTSWENLYPIHFALIDNNIELLKLFLTSRWQNVKKFTLPTIFSFDERNEVRK